MQRSVRRPLVILAVVLATVFGLYARATTQTPIHVTGFKSGATPTPTPHCPTQGVLDNFNRADEGPPPSSSWLNGLQGSVDSTGIKVVSNVAVANTNAKAAATWNTVFNADQSVYAQLKERTGQTDVRLWVRVGNPTLSSITGYQFRYYFDGSAFKMNAYYLSDDSTSVQITSPSANVTFDYSVNDYISVTPIGTTFYICKSSDGTSWTEQGSFSDSTKNTSGYIGISLEGNSATSFDNFGGGNQ